MGSLEVKSTLKADETRRFTKGIAELVTLGGATVGKLRLEPGWKWSTHVKPIAKTESCEAPHFQYHLAGTLHIAMDDGTERDVGPGEFSMVPPGHDAWVVGNQAVVVVDFQGLVDYARATSKK